MRFLLPEHFLAGFAAQPATRQMPLPARFSAHLTRETVYTRLSNPDPQPLVSGECFSAGDEPIASQEEPQRLVSGLADADPRSDLNVGGLKSIVSNPQAGSRRSEIASVIAGAGDAEGFSQAAWAAGQPNKIARALQHDASCMRHFLDPLKRFERAEKNGTGFAFALARHVEAIVIAVDEINVGVAGRAEQDRIAGGVACGGVGRGIVCSEVGLDFDDAGRQAQLSMAAHQHLAQQLASHPARSAGEERARERA